MHQGASGLKWYQITLGLSKHRSKVCYFFILNHTFRAMDPTTCRDPTLGNQWLPCFQGFFQSQGSRILWVFEDLDNFLFSIWWWEDSFMAQVQSCTRNDHRDLNLTRFQMCKQCYKQLKNASNPFFIPKWLPPNRWTVSNCNPLKAWLSFVCCKICISILNDQASFHHSNWMQNTKCGHAKERNTVFL